MIRSMTAFARVSSSPEKGNWSVELHSLNHRYLEFSVKMPQSLYSLENRIRELVQSHISRGKVTLSIRQNTEKNEESKIRINDEMLELYWTAVNQIKKRFKIQEPVAIRDLLTLPQIFTVDRNEDDPEKKWRSLEKAITLCLKEAIKFKDFEGRKLCKDIVGRLSAVEKSLKRIEQFGVSQSERIHKKLKERVIALTEGENIDEERLIREVAFLAEKADITEEAVRMRSHLSLFGQRLKQNKEVGRELDFLCQEMNREMNTITNKAQRFDISKEVVFVKGELEKIREQIQNIE